MKRVLFLLVVLSLVLAACGGPSVEEAIVGKWTAAGTDEVFNTYEFFEDGTGFLSSPDGSFAIDFTWEFSDDSTMLFNVDDRGQVSVEVTMPDEDRLTFAPETSEETINLRRAEE